MKVEFGKVSSLGVNQRFSQPQQQNSKDNSVAFRGKYSSADVAQKLDSYMPAKVKFMKKLSKNLGEVQNTMINAIGTAFIAPIFIKYNFLSDTDEDTRTYSAWRQPISAVLTVATQVGLTAGPFNRAFAEMANKGVLSDEYNQTAFKDEAFIRKELKKQHPDYVPAQINAEVKEILAAQKEDLVNNIRNNNTIKISKYKKDGLFDVDKSVFDNAVTGTIDKLIKSEEDELKRLRSDKQTNRIKRRDFYRTHNKETLDFMTEVENIVNSNNLQDAKSLLKDKIKTMSGQDELKQIATEIVDLATAEVPKDDVETSNAIKEAMQEKIAKVRRTAENYGPTRMANKEAVEAAVKQELSQRVADVEETLNYFKELKGEIAKGKSVKEIEELIAQKAKSSKRVGSKATNFAGKVAEMFKTQVKGNIACNKQIGGLIVALAIAPLTCELLNVIYPIFMDAVFPNLSNGKGKKVNKQLVDQAPKKGSEVSNG